MRDPSWIPGNIYAATTGAITVTVQPFFLTEESAPDDHRFVWAYHVRIENKGAKTVQLLRRTWQITDGGGKLQEVHGDGVIGKQPVLKPGQAFEYASGCPLQTSSGFMVGTYHMVTEEGEPFDVSIPAFSLDSPYAEKLIH
jgi:ApaG protein